VTTGTLIILYVRDQDRSRSFYSTVLGCDPLLDVPGMTEFELPGGCQLGLMPEAGVRRLFGSSLPDPAMAEGVPRVELYLLVEDPGLFHSRALESGAREISALEERSWGDRTAYSLDPDGHVLAFAETVRHNP